MIDGLFAHLVRVIELWCHSSLQLNCSFFIFMPLMIKLRFASKMIFAEYLGIFVSSWRRKLQKGGPAGFHLIANLFASAARESVRDMQNNRDTTSSYKDLMFDQSEAHWNIYTQITTILLILLTSSQLPVFREFFGVLTKISYFYVSKQIVEEHFCKRYIIQNQLFVDVTLNFACLLITSPCCHSVCTQ